MAETNHLEVYVQGCGGIEIVEQRCRDFELL